MMNSGGRAGEARERLDEEEGKIQRCPEILLECPPPPHEARRETEASNAVT